jgi:hypothetical protein
VTDKRHRQGFVLAAVLVLVAVTCTGCDSSPKVTYANRTKVPVEVVYGGWQLVVPPCGEAKMPTAPMASEAWATPLATDAYVLPGIGFRPFFEGPIVATVIISKDRIGEGADPQRFTCEGVPPPTPGQEVVARLRAVAYGKFRDVIYKPPVGYAGASIDVYMLGDTTPAQADAIWCQVIAPTVADAQRHAVVAVDDTHVDVWSDAGPDRMAVGVQCPSPRPTRSPAP